MDPWIRFDDLRPSQGQFIAAITQHGDVPVEEWEKDLERNAVGTWIDGVVWEGNLPRSGFTHWLPLPDRPQQHTHLSTGVSMGQAVSAPGGRRLRGLSWF